MDRIDALLRETLSDLPVAPGGLERTMRRVQSRRRRRARLRVAGAAVVFAAVAVAAVNGFSGSTPPASATTIQVPGRIVDAVGATGRIWALTCTERCDNAEQSVGRLLAFDASSGRVLRTTAAVQSPQAVAEGEDSVWTADFWHSTVTRFSAQTGSRLATVSLTLPRPVAGGDDRFLPVDLTVRDGAVWVTTGRGYVARIDPATNRVTAMVKTADDSTGPMVAGGGSLWIGEGLEIGRLDVVTGKLSNTTIEGPGDRRLSIGALTLANGALWIGGEWATPSRDATGHRDYTITDEAVLVEVDPATGAVQSTTGLPHGSTLRSDSAGGLWLANPRRKELYEFSPRTRKIVASARVRAIGAVIPASGHRVWVASSANEFTLVDLGARPSP